MVYLNYVVFITFWVCVLPNISSSLEGNFFLKTRKTWDSRLSRAARQWKWGWKTVNVSLHFGSSLFYSEMPTYRRWKIHHSTPIKATVTYPQPQYANFAAYHPFSLLNSQHNWYLLHCQRYDFVLNEPTAAHEIARASKSLENDSHWKFVQTNGQERIMIISEIFNYHIY